MAVIIDGTNGPDRIVQNRWIELDVMTYSGNDEIILNRVDNFGGFNYVDAGSGHDIVRNSYEGGNEIYLGSGNDLYIHTGYALHATARDVVYGGGGHDTFKVLSFRSVYYGDVGNDLFLSAGYKNVFNGGTGYDTIDYSLQDSSGERGEGIYVDLDLKYAKTAYGREVLNSIENATGTRSNDTLIGTSGMNVLDGGNGNDQLEGLGGNDTLYGGNGNDILYGDNGHDDLYGGNGNDRLYGGNGDDDLYGGAGRDVLDGGIGNDHLYGGAGADFFRFSDFRHSAVGAKRDIIVDFRPEEGDIIDLRLIDANTRTARDDAFTFIGTARFSGTAGELRHTGAVISGDVNGDGRADFEINARLTKYYADDFLL